MPSAQVGQQVRVTSVGEMVTNEPVASPTARHMTRLVMLSQGWFASKLVGFWAASMAPSRAALAIAICDAYRRPRSSAPAKRSMKTGSMRANSISA